MPTGRPLLRTFIEDWARECGARVKARRKALGLTLAQVGEFADTTAQTINKVEAGEIVVREDLKLSLSMALGCEPTDLFPTPTSIEVQQWLAHSERVVCASLAAHNAGAVA